MLIWRLYPIALIAGATSGTAVALVLGVLGTALVPFVVGLDAASRDPVASTHIAVSSTPGALFLLGATAASYFTSGYISARYSPGEELANATAVGAVLLLLAILGYQHPPMDFVPGWLDASMASLSLPLSLAGGFAVLRRQIAA